MSLTPEQIKNTLEFKAVTKALKQKLPFITKVVLDKADVNRYDTLIFLKAYVNPYELAEYFDSELEGFVKYRLNKNRPFYTAYISTFLKDKSPKDFEDFEEDLNDLFKQIHQSPALPADTKLPGNKRFSLIDWENDPNVKVRDEEES